MGYDKRQDIVIRPSGLVEPLRPVAAVDDGFVPYASREERPGPVPGKHPADRRRRRRAGQERLKGRLVDVEA